MYFEFIMLNILITATPRLDLHEECCLKFIKQICQREKVKVVLNMDVPNILKDVDDLYINKCIKQFESISNIVLEYQIIKDGCSFRNAAKNVVTKSYEASNETDLFMWLEDDWSFEVEKFDEFYQKYNEFLTSSYDYFLLCAFVPSGNPFIYRYSFLQKQALWYKTHNQLKDPEMLIFDLAFPTEYKRKRAQQKGKLKQWPVVNAMYMPLFFDMGRGWRQVRNIQKINKKSSVNTTWK